MKYADVKAKKSNYVVFSPTVSNGQNFYVVSLPVSPFSNLTSRHLKNCEANLAYLRSLTDISKPYEHMSFPIDTQRET
jgi:hypothetical protein